MSYGSSPSGNNSRIALSSAHIRFVRLTLIDSVGLCASRLLVEVSAEGCFSLAGLAVDRNPTHHRLQTPLRHMVSPEAE